MKKVLSISMLLVVIACALTSCMHKHEWTPATCAAPKTCAVCNQTEGTALGHNYSNGICTVCDGEDPVYVEKYDEATRFIESRNYVAAYEAFKELGGYKDSEAQLEHFKSVATIIQYDSWWWGGNEGVISKYSIELFYNEQNLPWQQILTSPDGDKAIDIYTYDAQGKLIQNVHTFYDGDKYTDEYTYDENGNLIKEVSVWYDGDKYTDEYTYDASGILIKQVYTGSDGDKTIITYSYDANENLVKEVHTSDYGTKSIYDYSYDVNENLIKTVFTRPNGDKTIWNYTYDARGNLIKTVRTFDGDKDIYDYTYDASGNLIEEVYTDSDGTRMSAYIEYMFVYIPYDLTEKTTELLDPTNYYFVLIR